MSEPSEFLRMVVSGRKDFEEAKAKEDRYFEIAVVKTVKASLVESAWKESGLPDFAQETVSRTVYLRSGDLSEFLEEVDAEED